MTILSCIGHTPLLPLPRLGGILVKCEHLNPGGSIKDRIALAMVEAAEAEGRLRPGSTIIEATAGNTGVGLALVAADRGYTLVCVMPEKMSVDKRSALKMLGAQVIITPNAPLSDPQNFQNVARRLAAEHGWWWPDQFRNPANPRVHEEKTAMELLEQTGGQLGAFVAGAGTGGTLTGVARALRRHNPKIRIVLADPVGSALASWHSHGVAGVEAAYLVEGIGSGLPPENLDLSLIDDTISISDAESFAMTRRLIQEEGLLVGGSSGTNVAAALRYSQRADLCGPVATVLPDRMDRYQSQPWMQAWVR